MRGNHFLVHGHKKDLPHNTCIFHLLKYVVKIIFSVSHFTSHFFAKTLKPRSHCPGVRPGASRQFTAGGPERTGTNRDGIRVCSYIPGSATDQARFGAHIDHGMSR